MLFIFYPLVGAIAGWGDSARLFFVSGLFGGLL